MGILSKYYRRWQASGRRRDEIRTEVQSQKGNNPPPKPPVHSDPNRFIGGDKY